jgi:hypothetical protein
VGTGDGGKCSEADDRHDALRNLPTNSGANVSKRPLHYDLFLHSQKHRLSKMVKTKCSTADTSRQYRQSTNYFPADGSRGEMTMAAKKVNSLGLCKVPKGWDWLRGGERDWRCGVLEVVTLGGLRDDVWCALKWARIEGRSR